MSDTQIHPLLELFTLTGCDLITNEINLVIFTSLKDAIEADNLPTMPSDEVAVGLDGSIRSSHDLWDKQDDLLTMMIKNYALSATTNLISDLNNLSEQESQLYVDLEGSLYSGNLFIKGLDYWVEEFEDDKTELQSIYDKWENVINLLDRDALIQTLLEG